MKTMIVIIVAGGLIAQAFIGLSFFISSVLEREKRASLFAGVQFCLMIFLMVFFCYFYIINFFNTGTGIIIISSIMILGIGFLFFFARETPGNPKALKGTKGLIRGDINRFDERDHVFARNRSLPADSEQYSEYYSKYPEFEELDAKRRKKGGPIGIPGSIDNPGANANIAGIMASLSMPQYLSTPEKYNPAPHIFIKNKLNGEKIEISPEEAAIRIKGYAKALGASLVGITKINQSWIYSNRGEIFNENWEEWGKKIDLTHTHAIVLAHEMDLDMVGSAPHTPTCIESMINYAKGSYISTQVASYIANLGFDATANHFRHYDTLMVPLAVDAGLGEVGRLGYLITKKYGPRVRLSLVTTDLPLMQDKPVDIGVEDFCTICKKCAVCCPSNSIPHEDQIVANGTLRWKMNAQSCFEYWGKIGTDCNICMNVCPWSHADTFPHRIIKTLISRNNMSRKLFNLMDDVFYGKKPKSKPAIKWAQFRLWDINR